MHRKNQSNELEWTLPQTHLTAKCGRKALFLVIISRVPTHLTLSVGEEPSRWHIMESISSASNQWVSSGILIVLFGFVSYSYPMDDLLKNSLHESSSSFCSHLVSLISDAGKSISPPFCSSFQAAKRLHSLEQATETCMRSKLNLPIFTGQSRHLNLFMFNNIFMSRLILSMAFIPVTAAPQRRMRHNIHGPWIVDGVDFHSLFILNYVNVTNADSLSHCRPGIISLFCLYQLSCSIHQNSLIMWWKTNSRNRLLCRLHLTSFTGMNSAGCFIYHLASSCIPSVREVAPLSFHETCPSVSLSDSEWRNMMDSIVLKYTFFQRTICFEQIEYQLRHLDNTQISVEIQGRGILAYKKG